MQRVRKSASEQGSNRTIVKAQYTKGAQLMILPLLIFSELCGAIGKLGSGPVGFLSKYWLVCLVSFICVAGLSCRAFVEIFKGVRLSREHRHKD